MALSERRAWLVAYDIADRRRLVRVHRLLTRAAVPVQYSLFRFVGSPMQLGNLVAAIGKIIDPRADDVRVYQIPERPSGDALGRGMLPDGVLLPESASSGISPVLTPAGACDDDRTAAGTRISVPAAE